MRRALLLLALLALTPAAAMAQDPETRAGQLAREREEKQKSLQPYTPSGLESAMTFGETRIAPILQRDGFHTKLGSLTTGSGFAYGGGFRNRAVYKGQGAYDVWAAASLRGYWAVEARGMSPLVSTGAVAVEGVARRFDYTREEFSGLGPNSRQGDRVTYGLSGTSLSAALHLRPARLLRFGAHLEHLRPRSTSRGDTDDDDPAIDDLFPPSERPGLGTTVNFLRVGGSAEVDYRQPINARRGGYYRVDVSRYADRNGGAFDFTRVDVDLRQYVSFLAERRVLVARAWVSSTETADGDQIPFFMMPAIGGNTLLRGFRFNRFRGEHAMVLQGEYRFELWAGLEAAMFYEAGKVTRRRADLNFKDLERDYGFGFRFNTDAGVVMRVDAAFGSRDGKHLHIVFGGFF